MDPKYPTSTHTYFWDGKRNGNSSHNNQMMPKPLPDSIKAACDVDLAFEGQAL